MERSPARDNTSRVEEVCAEEARVAAKNSPSVAVRSVDVDAEIQQELDDVVVSCADCVVQRRDALIVGSAGVLNLEEKIQVRF